VRAGENPQTRSAIPLSVSLVNNQLPPLDKPSGGLPESNPAGARTTLSGSTAASASAIAKTRSGWTIDADGVATRIAYYQKENISKHFLF
jgi:hypothetical protein